MILPGRLWNLLSFCVKILFHSFFESGGWKLIETSETKHFMLSNKMVSFPQIKKKKYSKITTTWFCGYLQNFTIVQRHLHKIAIFSSKHIYIQSNFNMFPLFHLKSVNIQSPFILWIFYSFTIFKPAFHMIIKIFRITHILAFF